MRRVTISVILFTFCVYVLSRKNSAHLKLNLAQRITRSTHRWQSLRGNVGYKITENGFDW